MRVLSIAETEEVSGGVAFLIPLGILAAEGVAAAAGAYGGYRLACWLFS